MGNNNSQDYNESINLQHDEKPSGLVDMKYYNKTSSTLSPTSSFRMNDNGVEYSATSTNFQPYNKQYKQTKHTQSTTLSPTSSFRMNDNGVEYSATSNFSLHDLIKKNTDINSLSSVGLRGGGREEIGIKHGGGRKGGIKDSKLDSVSSDLSDNSSDELSVDSLFDDFNSYDISSSILGGNKLNKNPNSNKFYKKTDNEEDEEDEEEGEEDDSNEGEGEEDDSDEGEGEEDDSDEGEGEEDDSYEEEDDTDEDDSDEKEDKEENSNNRNGNTNKNSKGQQGGISSSDLLPDFSSEQSPIHFTRYLPSSEESSIIQDATKFSQTESPKMKTKKKPIKKKLSLTAKSKKSSSKNKKRVKRISKPKQKSNLNLLQPNNKNMSTLYF